MLLSIEEPAPTSARPQWAAFLELGFRPLYSLGCFWAIMGVLLWMNWQLALIALAPLPHALGGLAA